MIGIKTEYKTGMARDGTGVVDYMLGFVETEEGAIELYAEAPISDDETGTYETLRKEIVAQAAEAGIEGDILIFYYD